MAVDYFNHVVFKGSHSSGPSELFRVSMADKHYATTLCRLPVLQYGYHWLLEQRPAQAGLSLLGFLSVMKGSPED